MLGFKCTITVSAETQKAEPTDTNAYGLRLKIVHHQTLSFDLELEEELQRRHSEKYWTVILSLLKKKKL